MLVFLAELLADFPGRNVVSYITFRSGAAALTALLFVFLFGPAFIRALRVRQGKGQPISIVVQDGARGSGGDNSGGFTVRIYAAQ